MNKRLSLCMIGFGNAGKEFCKMLLEQHNMIKDTYDMSWSIQFLLNQRDFMCLKWCRY